MRFKFLFPSVVLVLCAIIGWFFMVPSSPCHPAEREIAITIDDVPAEDRVTMDRIMQQVLQYHAPVTLFVITQRMNSDDFTYLNALRQHQVIIGNHSDTHLNLKRVSAAEYIADVQRADERLTPLMSVQKYYRYPYLAMGGWFKKKKVMTYLNQHQYIIAPVTVDSRDFVMNIEFCAHPRTEQYINAMRQRYLTFVWKQTKRAEKKQQCKKSKQILLLHANTLNRYFLADLLALYQQHGYRFITLPEALKDKD